MKKNISTTIVLSIFLFFVPNNVVNANTCPFGGSPNWQGQCDTTTESGESYFGPPMSQEDANRYTEENSITVDSYDSVENNQNISINDGRVQVSDAHPVDSGMSPGEHGGWAIVNPDGSAGGTIVCTPEVCGQTGDGSLLDTMIKNGSVSSGATFIIQTLQDPVEAANSENGVGNVAGYSGARYDFVNKRWTIKDNTDKYIFTFNPPIYQIPLAYPGTDLGGNTNLLSCIENCPVEEPEGDIDILADDSPSEGPGGSNVIENTSSTETFARSIFVDTKTKNTSLSFVSKVHKKRAIRFGKIWVIAKNNIDKKIWKFDVKKKGGVLIVLPIKYSDWNIYINYELKNGKKISKRVIFNN